MHKKETDVNLVFNLYLIQSDCKFSYLFLFAIDFSFPLTQIQLIGFGLFYD